MVVVPALVLQVFDKTTGSYVRQFGSVGKGHGQLQNPFGVAVDGTYADDQDLKDLTLTDRRALACSSNAYHATSPEVHTLSPVPVVANGRKRCGGGSGTDGAALLLCCSVVSSQA